MKFNKLVIEFMRLGYELWYGMGEHGRGYYYREHGTITPHHYAKTRDDIDQRLDGLRFKQEVEKDYDDIDDMEVWD